ncbi:type IV pilus biogenesis protein FimU [Psychromonas marina]|uniref:Type II secretion system protein H n=1 Tax=Psychromonas marina TaxID=88364 RepID=A0ABQ6DWQ6_9GAMM|nr:GspH/FimT family pseudopilin [Psychromonas marina]GLS89545.1 type IV pilus biogenesis protein FimU [Psychromonas marina]
MNRFNTNKQGFTLVELMVTIAVAMILLFVVVPSFSGIIESSKERATRDLLVSSIFAAKQQAQSKRRTVYICPTTDDINCANSWGSNWLAYEDEDDSDDLSNGDIVFANVSSETDLIISNELQIAFSPTGHSTANIFQICSNTESTAAYQIQLTRMGRISYLTPTGGCP